ncbi:heavy-metal-associated domain-containing protein [Chloroflexota bacterium]
MMKPSWKLFALFGLAITVMLGLMVLFNLMLGGMDPMLYASQGLGMWGVMILPVVALLLMPVMKFFFFRLMSGSGGLVSAMMGRHYEPQSQTEKSNLTALTLTVPTVNCAHCRMRIEQALGSLPGVAATNVDVDDKQVVIGLISPPTRTEIEALSTEIGYPPESQQVGAASVLGEV